MLENRKVKGPGKQRSPLAAQLPSWLSGWLRSWLLKRCRCGSSELR
jgi:hypothetical protein